MEKIKSLLLQKVVFSESELSDILSKWSVEKFVPKNDFAGVAYEAFYTGSGNNYYSGGVKMYLAPTTNSYLSICSPDGTDYTRLWRLDDGSILVELPSVNNNDCLAFSSIKKEQFVFQKQ